ncbi:MAG: response regulator [Pseudomonadota bacterium]
MDGKVLIVEDEPHIVESLRFILSRAGFDVTAVEDAESGMASLASERPDVMVLDAMLPGASGFEMLRAIRSTPAISHLPVLMLTAKGQRRDREVAEDIGADMFMTKPFANAEVVDAVRELASRKRAERGAPS